MFLIFSVQNCELSYMDSSQRQEANLFSKLPTKYLNFQQSPEENIWIPKQFPFVLSVRIVICEQYAYPGKIKQSKTNKKTVNN